MAPLDPSVIASWHAHVYFDAASRDAAWALRTTIERELAGKVAIGRFHERPVGPQTVVGWLALNHGALDVFMHPNSGDELRDHRDSALWLGRSHVLNLAALGGS